MGLPETLAPLVKADWKLQALLLYLVYRLTVIAYRLYLHPLAGVPGPKLAAITSWWEVFYNVSRQGQLEFELFKLHKKYGPIVRISPRSVHIADPEAYEKIYFVGSPFTKDPAFYKGGFGTETFFTAETNVEHRALREPLNPFFSRKNVLEFMQPLVRQVVEKLSKRLDAVAGKNKPLDIYRAFRCISTDVITLACWGYDDELILDENFAPKMVDGLQIVPMNVWNRVYFPTFTYIMTLIPPKIISMMHEGLASMFYVLETAQNQAKRVYAEVKKPGYDGSQPTIFHVLVSDHEHAKRKRQLSFEEMSDVGVIIYGAAVETTASTLTHTVFRVLQDEAIHKRLRKELIDAFPDPNEVLDLQKLEQLPFLTACIQEGLRVSIGVTTRLPRNAPKGGFVYGKHLIPEGYQVGMSSLHMMHNEKIFPEPKKFVPERWLDDSKNLDKYFVPFSKGTRQCIGINLAWCEMYLTLGTLFRRFNLKVVDTGPEDMEITHDFFNAWHNPDARKLKLTSEKL